MARAISDLDEDTPPPGSRLLYLTFLSLYCSRELFCGFEFSFPQVSLQFLILVSVFREVCHSF